LATASRCGSDGSVHKIRVVERCRVVDEHGQRLAVVGRLDLRLHL
jgi:hypothetical protein